VSPTRAHIEVELERARAHLTDELLPFWMQRAPDAGHGGFLTWFGADGEPSGETSKPVLAQARLLYAFARAQRAGLGGARCAELAGRAADFLHEHAWDERHGGWFWLLDRDGHATDRSKIGYGQAFCLYAFAEHHRASGEPRSLAAAERTAELVAHHMLDPEHGGYLELFERDWTPAPGGAAGGDRKSLDVHLHLFEAYTSLVRVTGSATHARRLRELGELILARMLDPTSGAGGTQFALDWTPLRAIELSASWGADVPPADGEAHPLEWCSFGHDLELAWLLLRGADALGLEAGPWFVAAQRLVEHARTHGLDQEHGGVFTEGPRGASPAATHKQFWSQAEALVGFLDAWRRFGDERDWQAFVRVHDFVHARLRAPASGGEWRLLVDRAGAPLDARLGTGFKIAYHTVRSMIEVVERLQAARRALGE